MACRVQGEHFNMSWSVRRACPWYSDFPSPRTRTGISSTPLCQTKRKFRCMIMSISADCVPQFQSTKSIIKRGPTVILRTRFGYPHGTWCLLVGILINHPSVSLYLWQNAKVPQLQWAAVFESDLPIFLVALLASLTLSRGIAEEANYVTYFLLILLSPCKYRCQCTSYFYACYQISTLAYKKRKTWCSSCRTYLSTVTNSAHPWWVQNYIRRGWSRAGCQSVSGIAL